MSSAWVSSTLANPGVFFVLYSFSYYGYDCYRSLARSIFVWFCGWGWNSWIMPAIVTVAWYRIVIPDHVSVYSTLSQMHDDGITIRKLWCIVRANYLVDDERTMICRHRLLDRAFTTRDGDYRNELDCLPVDEWIRFLSRWWPLMSASRCAAGVVQALINAMSNALKQCTCRYIRQVLIQQSGYLEPKDFSQSILCDMTMAVTCAISAIACINEYKLL